MATAFGFGQPSRGATIRIRSNPKFHIARAAAPAAAARLTSQGVFLERLGITARAQALAAGALARLLLPRGWRIIGLSNDRTTANSLSELWHRRNMAD